jgi:hypothetical protein
MQDGDWLLFYSSRHAELVSASIVPRRPKGCEAKWTLNQVQGDGEGRTLWLVK